MDARVRPARPGDKAPLMSFIRNIWSGRDYIPKVWDQWLSDKEGKMFVVEADGVPVGMNRVRFLEDGSAWFEGARIHPSYRRRGLASMLGENSLRFARAKGITVFRLTSGSRNMVAHKQIGKMRFREVSRFRVYEPPRGAKRGRGESVEEVGAEKLLVAMGLIRGSKEFKLGTGVYWHYFAATSLTRDVVKHLIAEGAVWRSGRAVAVVREGREGSDIWEEIGFVGGPVVDAMELVRFLAGWGKRAAERIVFLPRGSPIVSALRKEGYQRNFSMLLFERRATNG